MVGPIMRAVLRGLAGPHLEPGGLEAPAVAATEPLTIVPPLDAEISAITTPVMRLSFADRARRVQGLQEGSEEDGPAGSLCTTPCGSEAWRGGLLPAPSSDAIFAGLRDVKITAADDSDDDSFALPPPELDLDLSPDAGAGSDAEFGTTCSETTAGDVGSKLATSVTSSVRSTLDGGEMVAALGFMQDVRCTPGPQALGDLDEETPQGSEAATHFAHGRQLPSPPARCQLPEGIVSAEALLLACAAINDLDQRRDSSATLAQMLEHWATTRPRRTLCCRAVRVGRSRLAGRRRQASALSRPRDQLVRDRSWFQP